MVLVSGKNGFSFWFQFLPKRRGWGILASFEAVLFTTSIVTARTDLLSLGT